MTATRITSAVRALARLTPPVAAARMYSRFFVDHQVPLESALDAERHEIETADAGTISYYADTSRDTRPLVLLHGVHAAASAYDVRPLFQRFRSERRVYAVDLPGFGFSQRDAREYSAETYVHAIEHILRQLATKEGADVIALSLTSEYVARVAHDMPELVRSLVLISPTGFSTRREMTELEKRARGGDGSKLEGIRHVLGSQTVYDLLVSRPSLRYFLRKSFYGPIDDKMVDYDYATSHQLAARFAPLAFVQGKLFPPGSALDAYDHVRAPTLVLYDQDGYTGFGELPAFAHLHPNFRVVRIPHTRGLPHFEARERTMHAIRDFWETLDREELGIGATPRYLGSA